MAVRKRTAEAVEVTEHPLMERPSEDPEELSIWGDCPLDILLIVFEWLEPVDLMNCIQVNTYWRDSVNYMGLHRGIWKQLAQAGMVNKGIDLRRRANPKLDWRDLYINYRQWHRVQHAHLSWTYELSDRDIRYLHVYKDILIMETDENFSKKYYHIKDRLQDVSKRLVDAGEAYSDGVEQATDNGGENDLEPQHALRENYVSKDGEEHYMADKMIKKLVQEAPFTRLLVLDEECYYMLNHQNILRCAKWDETNRRWLTYVLARYYMCNKSISDINVYNNDVYMLLKTGLAFKLDRTGRNFLPDRRFNAYLTPAQFEVSRMIYGEIDSMIQREGALNIPEYGTGMNVMFHKVSVVVSVPWDKKFKINEDEKTGNIVIEYPGLSCATQHGEVLLLGFMDGKIEVCIPKNLILNGGKCEASANVQECPSYPAVRGEDPAIVALEVCEERHAHHLFVATHASVYRLTVTHPQLLQDELGLDKEFALDD